MKNLIKYLKYTLLTLIGIALLIVAIFWRNDIPLEDLKKKYATGASQFMEVEGLQVHYRDEGNKNDTLPLVLIHGTGASLHTWEGWIQALKADHRIITLDLPAYGLTGPNQTGNYSMKYYTQFLDAFLNKLNVSKFILGGNSLGGSITWQYALVFPTKVAKMILVDAGGYPMQSKSVPIAFRLAAIPILSAILKNVTPRSIAENSLKNVYVNDEKVTPALVDRYLELTLREGNRKAFIDRIKMHDFGEKDINYLKINTLSIPTLVLWGAQDGLIPISVAEHFHTDLPHDTLVILENLGHTPMEEEPKKTVNVVKEFLSKKE
jgi:pimeloyl-ACP methyl ester carboxylesterase